MADLTGVGFEFKEPKARYGKKRNKSQMKICDPLIKRNAPAIKQGRQANDAIVSAVITF